MPPHHRGLLLASALALLCPATPTSSAPSQLAAKWHQPLPLQQHPAAPLHPGAEPRALRLRGGVSREDLEARAAEMRKKEDKTAPGGEKAERKGGAGAGGRGAGGGDAAGGDDGMLKVSIGGEEIAFHVLKIDEPITLEGEEEEQEQEVPSVLFLAASSGDAAAIETLLGHGAKHSKLNTDGDTPLHIAAFHGNAEAAAALCKGGASPDVANKYGATPLHAAAAGESANAIPALLAAKASKTAVDKLGHTPRELALALEHPAAAAAIGE